MQYFKLETRTVNSSDAFVNDVIIDKSIYELIDEGVSLKDTLDCVEATIKNSSGDKNDFLLYRSYFPLVSDRVKDVLESFYEDLPYLEFFKVRFNKDIKESYWFVNIFDNIDAIDRDKSEYTIYPDFMGVKAGKIESINSMALKESVIGKRNIFRLTEQETYVMVSEKLHEAFLNIGITGFEACSF
jgi:hypothetical protein